MKTRRVVLIAVVLAVASITALLATKMAEQPQPPALAAMVPDGALLYLESPDFQSLLSDWNQSPEKRPWLKSDNYAVFSRSRLFQRLSAAQSEFATAAGLPPDMQFVSQIAGRQSAFAWYDIGKLEFIYVTRLPSGALSQSSLWSARSKFQHRETAGSDFYVRADPQSNRTVAFASIDDWLILGTREDLVADTLTLVKGSKGHSLSEEPWYADAVSQAKAPGDLRMVLNLEKIVPSPYFRSYWVQQNITDMKQYRAAVCDLYREKSVYREERVLLKGANASVSQPEAEAEVSRLAATAAPETGFYLATATPAEVRTLAVLKEKLLDPRPANATESRAAPNPALTETNAGQASDLDIHIDQAPVDVDINSSSPDSWEPIKSVINDARVTAMLEVESSAKSADTIFSGFHTAVVLSSSSDWQIDRLQSAISLGLRSRLTASHLGVQWSQKSNIRELDGLLPLFLGVQGRYLILSNDRDLLTALSAKLAHPAVDTEPALYVAGLNHAAESETFSRITTLIDRANQRGSSAGDSHSQGDDWSPAFFSGNIASLTHAFNAMISEKIVVRDAGEKVSQTVTYQWK